jgi:hypothetical protein
MEMKPHVRKSYKSRKPKVPLQLPARVYVNRNTGKKQEKHYGTFLWADCLKGGLKFTWEGKQYHSAFIFEFPDVQNPNVMNYYVRPTNAYQNIRGDETGKGWSPIYVADQKVPGAVDKNYHIDSQHFNLADYRASKSNPDNPGFLQNPNMTVAERDRYCRLAMQHYDRKKFVTILGDIGQKQQMKQKAQKKRGTKRKAPAAATEEEEEESENAKQASCPKRAKMVLLDLHDRHKIVQCALNVIYKMVVKKGGNNEDLLLNMRRVNDTLNCLEQEELECPLQSKLRQWVVSLAALLLMNSNTANQPETAYALLDKLYMEHKNGTSENEQQKNQPNQQQEEAEGEEVDYSNKTFIPLSPTPLEDNFLQPFLPPPLEFDEV